MKATRSLLVSCLLALLLAHSAQAAILPRQSNTPPPPAGGGGAVTPPPTPSVPVTDDTNTSRSTSPPPADNTPAPSTPLPNTPVPETTPPPINTSVSTTPPPSSPTPPPVVPPPVIESTGIDEAGSTFTVTETNTNVVPSPSATDAGATSPPDESTGLGTGSIIGLSVAGGVAVIGIIGFLIWKFTRKRFSDFDDNEAIKWPELNAHGGGVDSHPLPVHNTGRAGFGAEAGSEASLSRVTSASQYSAPDHGGLGGPDPYAVPPLPHLNPNQPYRDDPTGASGYYDPYRGPIPGTLENGQGAQGEWGGEAIPMTQMAQGAGGRMSPGPHAAYDQGYGGRVSPGPQVAYGGRTSPGPQAAYGVRTASPGPQAAYGGGGRASPGPQAAYGGRQSPGPQVVYDNYGR